MAIISLSVQRARSDPQKSSQWLVARPSVSDVDSLGRFLSLVRPSGVLEGFASRCF